MKAFYINERHNCSKKSFFSERGSKKKPENSKTSRQALLNFYLSAADLNWLHPGKGNVAASGDEKAQTFLF